MKRKRKKIGTWWLFREFSHSSCPCLLRLCLFNLHSLSRGPASAARTGAVPLPYSQPQPQWCTTGPVTAYPGSCYPTAEAVEISMGVTLPPCDCAPPTAPEVENT